jgi:hypothetical protein
MPDVGLMRAAACYARLSPRLLAEMSKSELFIRRKIAEGFLRN